MVTLVDYKYCQMVYDGLFPKQMDILGLIQHVLKDLIMQELRRPWQ